MQNEVRESLRKICALLNKHNVEYMLIGGVAVGFYGYGFPRSTADIDFWYNPTNHNFLNLIRAFDEFGVDTKELKEITFDPNKTFLRIPQLGFRTEFLPKIPGINSFTQSKKNSTKTEFDDVEVFILGYDDLIRNKQAINRVTRNKQAINRVTDQRDGGIEEAQ